MDVRNAAIAVTQLVEGLRTEASRLDALLDIAVEDAPAKRERARVAARVPERYWPRRRQPDVAEGLINPW